MKDGDDKGKIITRNLFFVWQFDCRTSYDHHGKSIVVIDLENDREKIIEFLKDYCEYDDDLTF